MRERRCSVWPLAFLLLSQTAPGAKVLTLWEEGTRDAVSYQMRTVMTSAEGHVRVESTETREGKTRIYRFYYDVARDAAVFVDPEKGARPAVTRETVVRAHDLARSAGHKRSPGNITVVPLHTTHVVGGWTCAAFAAKRPGQANDVLYLADAASLGIDPGTLHNLKAMGDLMVAFTNAGRLVDGKDLREALNTYGLSQGFPVREFRSKDGVVETDTVLVSVETKDVPTDFFVPPPAALSASAPARIRSVRAQDHSLDIAAYAALGIPPPDRPWGGDEYGRAEKVLKTLAARDATQLPRRGSPRSGRLFSRMVDPDNLTTSLDSRDAAVRLVRDGAVVQGFGHVMEIYGHASRGATAFDEEIAQLMSFALFAIHRFTSRTDDFLMTLPVNDPRGPQFLKAREDMRGGVAETLNGCLALLEAPEELMPSDRLLLAKAAEEHVPALRRYLTPEAREALSGQIRRLAGAERDEAVRASLARLDGALAKRAAR